MRWQGLKCYCWRDPLQRPFIRTHDEQCFVRLPPVVPAGPNTRRPRPRSCGRRHPPLPGVRAAAHLQALRSNLPPLEKIPIISPPCAKPAVRHHPRNRHRHRHPGRLPPSLHHRPHLAPPRRRHRHPTLHHPAPAHLSHHHHRRPAHLLRSPLHHCRRLHLCHQGRDQEL